MSMRSRLPQIAITLAICWLFSGCGEVPTSSSKNSTTSQRPAAKPAVSSPPQPVRKRVVEPGSTGIEPGPDPAPPSVDPEAPRSPLPIQIAGTDNGGPPTVDQQRVKAAGLRVLKGTWIIPFFPALYSWPPSHSEPLSSF